MLALRKLGRTVEAGAVATQLNELLASQRKKRWNATASACLSLTATGVSRR